MRITSLLRTLLGLEGTRVRDVQFDETGLVADVAPTWQRPRCSECGRKCAGYDRIRGRRWRHLDLAGMTLHLRYDTRRVDCPDCGVKVEQLPWTETSSWFTRPFEDHVGYVAQRCDRTTVGAMCASRGRPSARSSSAWSRGTATAICSTGCVDELSYPALRRLPRRDLHPLEKHSVTSAGRSRRRRHGAPHPSSLLSE